MVRKRILAVMAFGMALFMLTGMFYTILERIVYNYGSLEYKLKEGFVFIELLVFFIAFCIVGSDLLRAGKSLNKQSPIRVKWKRVMGRALLFALLICVSEIFLVINKLRGLYSRYGEIEDFSMEFFLSRGLLIVFAFMTGKNWLKNKESRININDIGKA